MFFSKASVYLFFIISGMVLFKRSYSYREIGGKVVKKTLTIVLVSFYYLYFIENVSFDFIDYIRRIINYLVLFFDLFWYLYCNDIVARFEYRSCLWIFGSGNFCGYLWFVDDWCL